MNKNKQINDIINYLKSFDNESIYELEKTQDKQFIVLNNLWQKIKNKNHENDYLFLIIQNSLISYQLSWSGENRWEEFSNKALEYFTSNIDNNNRRKSILKNCKNNCRLNQMKINRIEKINSNKEILNNLISYENNQQQLIEILWKIMNQNTKSKTIVFAIKMYIYWMKIIKEQNIEYDKSIWIPVDSRLEKIYLYLHNWKIENKSNIYKFFLDLSKEVDICPLWLDSVLWINYRHQFKDLIIRIKNN